MRLIQGLMLLLSALTGADAAVSAITIPEPLRPWLGWYYTVSKSGPVPCLITMPPAGNVRGHAVGRGSGRT